MTSLTIRIQSLADAANGQPVFPGLTEDNTHIIQALQVGILEGGTLRGKTSIMFQFTHQGQHYVAETTAALLQGVASAVAGAQQRFGDIG